MMGETGGCEKNYRKEGNKLYSGEGDEKEREERGGDIVRWVGSWQRERKRLESF
jgi:hypothetical protein